MNLLKSTSAKSIFIFLFSLMFSISLFAQVDDDKQKSTFWKNVRFSSGIGLSTGNNFFSATVAPSAVYQFNRNVGLGLGVNWSYNKRKNFFKSTILGGSLIGLFNPINDIQLSAEFEQLNVNRKFEGANANIADQNFWVPALFVGAGYRTRFATVGVRYDLLYDESKSVYANALVPFVRVFF